MLLEAKTLTGFLFLFAKVVRLGWVFLRSLWDFVPKFSLGHPGFCWRILRQVGNNLSWWNNLLLKFNGVLFFDNKRRETYQLFTDKLLLGLEGFYYNHSSAFLTDVIIKQNTVFVAMRKNCKGGYLPHKSLESIIRVLSQGFNVQLRLPVSIRIFEVQAILLRFQLPGEK